MRQTSSSELFGQLSLTNINFMCAWNGRDARASAVRRACSSSGCWKHLQRLFRSWTAALICAARPGSNAPGMTHECAHLRPVGLKRRAARRFSRVCAPSETSGDTGNNSHGAFLWGFALCSSESAAFTCEKTLRQVGKEKQWWPAEVSVQQTMFANHFLFLFGGGGVYFYILFIASRHPEKNRGKTSEM